MILSGVLSQAIKKTGNHFLALWNGLFTYTYSESGVVYESTPVAVDKQGYDGAFSRDGKVFATRMGNFVYIFDNASGVLTLRYTFSPANTNITSVALNADGTVLYCRVSSTSLPVLIYAIGPSSATRIPHTDSFDFSDGISLSPDGSWLVCGSYGAFRVYAVNGDGSLTFHSQTSLSSGVRSIAWNPDGSRFVVCRITESPQLYAFSSGTVTFVKNIGGGVGFTLNNRSAAWSADGKYVAFAFGWSPYVLLYSVDGETFTSLAISGGAGGGTYPSYAVAFSPDSKFLAVGCRSGSGTQGRVNFYSLSGSGGAYIGQTDPAPWNSIGAICFY